MGTGDRRGERSLGGQGPGRNSAHADPPLLAWQCPADGNAWGCQAEPGVRAALLPWQERDWLEWGWSLPCATAPGLPYPTPRPARHSMARHRAVRALTRQRVPQVVPLALSGRSQHRGGTSWRSGSIPEHPAAPSILTASSVLLAAASCSSSSSSSCWHPMLLLAGKIGTALPLAQASSSWSWHLCLAPAHPGGRR